MPSEMKHAIYTVGGTVQAGGGLYISRRADDELLNLCRQSAFAYILTARQTGKSSLMVRTADRLAKENVRPVMIDLTQIGAQVTPEQWYLGLLAVIEGQLALSTDAAAWWRERAGLGFTQRLTDFFQKVLLREVAEPVVVFVDEIGATLGLDFTDDFFATIRYLYNARAAAPEFKRLSFSLIGVATPGDLIRDPQRTPFGVGRRVDLGDFTYEEAAPLAEGLNLPPGEAKQALRWAMKWTNGHPYLTQRLCRAMADAGRLRWIESDVDRMVADTFFGAMGEQDDNLQFVHDMLTKLAPDVERTLTTYRGIRAGNPAPDEWAPVKSHLKLSGVVRRERGRAAHTQPDLRGGVRRAMGQTAFARRPGHARQTRGRQTGALCGGGGFTNPVAFRLADSMESGRGSGRRRTPNQGGGSGAPERQNSPGASRGKDRQYG